MHPYLIILHIFAHNCKRDTKNKKTTLTNFTKKLIYEDF